MRIGVNRSGLYNYMRTDDRYRPHSYILQFALEELINNLRESKDL
nr:MAG TPA: DNA-packaging protein [Caudoviricetes sp.]